MPVWTWPVWTWPAAFIINIVYRIPHLSLYITVTSIGVLWYHYIIHMLFIRLVPSFLVPWLCREGV